MDLQYILLSPFSDHWLDWVRSCTLPSQGQYISDSIRSNVDLDLPARGGRQAPPLSLNFLDFIRLV